MSLSFRVRLLENERGEPIFNRTDFVQRLISVAGDGVPTDPAFWTVELDPIRPDAGSVVRRELQLSSNAGSASTTAAYRLRVVTHTTGSRRLTMNQTSPAAQRISSFFGIPNVETVQLSSENCIVPAPSPPPFPPPLPLAPPPLACFSPCMGSTCGQVSALYSCDELQLRGCNCFGCCSLHSPPAQPPAPPLPPPLTPPLPPHAPPQCSRPCREPGSNAIRTCFDWRLVATCDETNNWGCDCGGCCFLVTPPTMPPSPPLPPPSPLPLLPPPVSPVTPPRQPPSPVPLPPSPPPPVVTLGPCDLVTNGSTAQCTSSLVTQTSLEGLEQLLQADPLAGHVVHLELGGGQFRSLLASPPVWRRRLTHYHASLGPGPSQLALSNRTRVSHIIVEGGSIHVKNLHQDCWHSCSGTPGACPGFCGSGGACCREGFSSDPLECGGAGGSSRHECIAMAGGGSSPTASPSSTASPLLLSTLQALKGSRESIITTRPGAPAVTLRRIQLQGLGTFDGGDSAAVSIDGSTLTMEDCVLTGHASGALRVTGNAHITLTRCVFTYNGMRTLSSGGAVSVTNLARVDVFSSNFSHNLAKQGGAIYAQHATLSLVAAHLSFNNATEAGGGLFAVDTVLAMRNATFFQSNVAEVNGQGQSMFLLGGINRYILPAPVGHYVQGAALCDPQALCGSLSTNDCATQLALAQDGCDMNHAGLHLVHLRETVENADFPPPCSCAPIRTPLQPHSPSACGLLRFRCSLLSSHLTKGALCNVYAGRALLDIQLRLTSKTAHAARVFVPLASRACRARASLRSAPSGHTAKQAAHYPLRVPRARMAIAPACNRKSIASPAQQVGGAVQASV
jgi:predicted outer membrane repeat protein